MDPVEDIAIIASQHNIWLHVDAAMAGSAMLLPECRHLWQGVEQADSVAWNPHKWMGTILDTALFYVRDVEHLERVMSTNPAYLRSTADGQVTQYRDWGIPLGRRFRALKLWFHLCAGSNQRLDPRDVIDPVLEHCDHGSRAAKCIEPGSGRLALVGLCREQHPIYRVRIFGMD